MKNILIIAYYFPPSGGPGVQRVLKHVKYLREFGWNPIVLTVSNGQFPARDESLLEQIPQDIIVERTEILEPYDLYRKFTGKPKGSAIDVNVIKKDGEKSGILENIAEFIRATFFIPDARIGWIFSAGKKADELIKKYDIKAVYSSSPPYTCALIARNVKRRHNIPWIAGFRDPWTGFISSPKRWFLPAMIDRAMEKSVFTEANLVECAWEGIIKDAQDKFPNIDKDKFLHIPNGFDSEDYPEVEFKRNEKFTLTYTGSMYGRRNPKALFSALEELVKEKNIELDKLHIKLIGRFGDEIHDMINKTSINKNIEVISYLPHKQSIEGLMLSDALLLIVDESKESSEIVPGKVYEYLGCKKPILAIAPEQGAIASLIKETKSGLVAHQDNTILLKESILKLYSNWLNNSNDIKPNSLKISSYERKNAAQKLAKNLDNLADKGKTKLILNSLAQSIKEKEKRELE